VQRLNADDTDVHRYGNGSSAGVYKEDRPAASIANGDGAVGQAEVIDGDEA
jgi:hypothetical protein